MQSSVTSTMHADWRHFGPTSGRDLYPLFDFHSPFAPFSSLQSSYRSGAVQYARPEWVIEIKFGAFLSLNLASMYLVFTRTIDRKCHKSEATLHYLFAAKSVITRTPCSTYCKCRVCA